MNTVIINKILERRIPEKISLKLLNRFTSQEEREDYIQEMYLILLEIDEDKLIRLDTGNELENYFSRICLNQLVNTKSNWHKLNETYIKKEKINEKYYDE